MISVPQAAALWHNAGVSTIPIQTNGTKRPAIRWADYQARIPELGEIERWWGNGQEYGLAVICGAVSGNLEMTELEGKVALDSDLMARLQREFEFQGLEWLWEGLRQTYSEWTPSGGIHLIYRISDHPVPGNEKVARRPATEEELAENPQDKIKTLAETRGEGGYVIVAPTSGFCHPSGESWNLLGNSVPGNVPTITWEERNLLHGVLSTVLDETIETPAPSSSLVATTSPGQHHAEGAGSRPGDEWAERTSWADILEPAGWTWSHRSGREDHWTRPGKSKRDGTSATTNYQDTDLLKVFSSSTEFDTDGTYTKFGAFATLYYNGDHREAARGLARSGYGTPSISARANNEENGYIEEDDYFTLDDVGNGERMERHRSVMFPDLEIRDVHRWVTEEKAARVWDGTCWVQNESAIYWETDAITRAMMNSDVEAISKHGVRSRTGPKQREMAKAYYTRRGNSVSTSDFDAQSRYLNLENGVYDLKTGELHDHHPDFMITRKFGACYDANAKAPQWEAFMAAALPDDELRGYVQRCLGYTLLGDPSERAMFIVYGPSGTGKSTFLETINHIFGDYGDTAPAGTFRAVKDENASSATLGLHQLRGRRFVTTSETSEGVQWNEELIKRYTGHDLMRTRGLFERFQTWKSEASIWLATNHAPRFNSDDRAIWNRVKLVPFTTVFLGEGQVRGMDEILIKEADGILNWLLEGLAEYHRAGLAEPGCVTSSVHALREQADSVIKFLDDKVAEGALTMEPTQAMKKVDLYQMYMGWCRMIGERAVGANRFLIRLKECDRAIQLSEDGRMVQGLGKMPGGWTTGF
jgi:putative DNA primase/helicase